MRIIHNDQEWLTSVHSLESSRNRFQARDSRSNCRRRNFKSDGRSDRRKNVVDVGAPHQSRAHGDRTGRRLGIEIQTGRREREFARGDFACAQSVAQRARRDAFQALAVRIVSIDHANARRAIACAFKQAALRRKVGLE